MFVFVIATARVSRPLKSYSEPDNFSQDVFLAFFLVRDWAEILQSEARLPIRDSFGSLTQSLDQLLRNQVRNSSPLSTLRDSCVFS